MTNGPGQGLRILFVTQELNSSSVNLAVAHNWTGELAKRVDSVHVLAGRVVDTELPPNVYVHSMGCESSRSRGRRVYQFGATCVSLLASGRVNAVFAHMVPAYAVAIGPVARLARAPLVLWYTSHGKSSALIWANRIVNAAVTASVESYPIPSNRAFLLGHGIDTQRFAPSGLPLSGTGAVLGMAGRLTPLKGFDTGIRALATLRNNGYPNASLRIAGEPFYSADHQYVKDLRLLATELAVDQAVEFVGPVRGDSMAQFYRSLSVFVNWRMQPSLDKTGLEAMACGIPLITNNSSYRNVMGKLAHNFLVGDTPAELARGIDGVLGLHPNLLDATISRLRTSVVDGHGADGLVGKLVEVFDSVKRGDRPDFPSVAERRSEL